MHMRLTHICSGVGLNLVGFVPCRIWLRANLSGASFLCERGCTSWVGLGGVGPAVTGELLWQSFSRTQFTTGPRTSDRPEGCLPVPRFRSTASENSTRVHCGGYWLITGRIFSRFTTPAMESLTGRFPSSRPRSWKSSCVAGTRATGSLYCIAPSAKSIWQCHFLAKPACVPVASIAGRRS